MDLVGYTAMMASDEFGTHVRLNLIREQLIEPLLETWKGELVRLLGDGIVCSFEEADNAVRFAIEFHKKLETQYVDEPVFCYRIGINSGEVFHDDGEYYGTAVNIASRLQEIAPTGGICITDHLRNSLHNDTVLQFEFGGNHTFKNLYQLTPVWSWKEASGTSEHLVPKYFKKDSLPVIGILPFRNVGEIKDDNYFATGISDDLLVRLGYSKEMRVVRAYNLLSEDKPVELKQLADQMNATYLLLGTVRKHGSRLYVNFQLLEFGDGEQIGGKIYDEDLDNIHDVLDRITVDIVRLAVPAITKTELKKTLLKRPELMDAWDHFLQGKAEVVKFTQNGNVLAHRHFDESMRLDPNFPSAAAYKAKVLFSDGYLGWIKDSDLCFEEAYRYSKQASDKDNEEIEAHIQLTNSALVTGRYDKALSSGHKCVDINPNSSDAYFARGLSRLYAAELSDAIKDFDQSRYFNPTNPLLWLVIGATGIAHFCSGDYEKSLLFGKLSLEAQRGYLNAGFLTAISYAKLGRLDRAREAAIAFSDLTHEQKAAFLKNMPFKDGERVKPILEGLELVGW